MSADRRKEQKNKRGGGRFIFSTLSFIVICAALGLGMLGSAEAEKFSRLLLSDIGKAPESGGKRLLWIHVIPFLQNAPNALLSFSDRAYIAACDLAYENMLLISGSRRN